MQLSSVLTNYNKAMSTYALVIALYLSCPAVGDRRAAGKITYIHTLYVHVQPTVAVFS